MAHSFITNKDRLLSDIITGILPKSDAVDILVGYFYFSGYIQLTDKLADKHLRILVGLDIDTQISNRVREVEELMEWQRIRSKVREEYFNNLVRLINETDNTDTMKPSEYFVNFNIKFIMAHWKYVRPKTRVMRKCTFLLIIASITKMENNPVM